MGFWEIYIFLGKVGHRVCGLIIRRIGCNQHQLIWNRRSNHCPRGHGVFHAWSVVSNRSDDVQVPSDCIANICKGSSEWSSVVYFRIWNTCFGGNVSSEVEEVLGDCQCLWGLIEIQMKIRFLGELGRRLVVLGRCCIICKVVSLWWGWECYECR